MKQKQKYCLCGQILSDRSLNDKDECLQCMAQEVLKLSKLNGTPVIGLSGKGRSRQRYLMDELRRNNFI